MTMVEIPDMFEETMSRHQRLNAVREIGAKAREEFDGRYPAILEWFRKYDPLYLLSYCAFYMTSHPEGVDPEATGEMAFYPHYLEILQAFSLTQERHVSLEPLMQDGDRLVEDMREIGRATQLRWLDVPPAIDTDQEFAAYMLRTEMMANTTAVRNWAYFHQMKRITGDLASKVDKPFKARYGVKASTLIDLLFGLIEVVQERANEHRQKVADFLKKDDYRDVIRTYHNAFPASTPNEEGQDRKLWEIARKRLEVLKSMLLYHSDLWLHDIHTISLDDATMVTSGESSPEALRGVLDELSYSFGDLREFKKEHIVLANPVHHRPFIKSSSNEYYSSLWGLLPHVALTILEDLIWQEETLKKAYSKIKARYLEDELERLAMAGFPNGRVLRGIIWEDPATGRRFENDLTVLIDSFAVVFEAKSGLVSDPARRGAPNDLFETLQRLIEEPSEQALRFIEFLSRERKEHNLSNVQGDPISLDSRKIKYYIPVGVTFHDLGTIASNLKKLIRAGVTAKPLEELAPSMTLGDLEIVFDMLPLEVEKVHYLARRRELDAHLEFDGDEMDLLSFYLDHGFNIGDVEYSQDHVFNIVLKSKEIDPYVVGRSRGVDVEKPNLAMTNWWRDLLNTISTRRTEGWVETGFVLLNTTVEDQEKFERAVGTLLARIRDGKANLRHNWVMWTSGPERRRYVIVGYPYATRDKRERNGVIAHILEETEVKKARGAVVIGLDLNSANYPYSVIARRTATDLFDTLTLGEKK